MWPQIKRKQACFYDLSTCFGVFSASALRHFVFSGGLRPFWDFLAFERPDGLSQAKKSQKGLRPPEKTKCLQASAENTPKKVDSSWKNACFLFIFGPISYWRAFFHDYYTMGEEHNVVFGQGLKVNRAKSTLSSPSICLMRHIEGEESVLLALLTLSPCPKTTLCSSPIV